MKERTKTMKARIKTTGEVKELTQVKQHDWWMDGEGNAYSSTEFDPCDETEDKPKDTPILGLIKTVTKEDREREEREYWRDRRITFILKFVDIYQAPATNMEEIFTLADKYIERLKQYDK